jgi:hypothetical protein
MFIYQTNETSRSAITVHLRWLRKMGMPGIVQEQTAETSESVGAEHELIAPSIKINQIY